MPRAASALLPLLKQVSRSFYLTLRALPSGIRPQFGIAYLLARATDTIADTQIVPVERRLQALRELRERILGVRSAPVEFGDFTRAAQERRVLQHCDDAVREIEIAKITDPAYPADGSHAERELLGRIEEVLTVFATLAADDQQRIREVLETITSGQELDLQRFGTANAQQIVALKTDNDLDDYTYRVAGCVGEFWTKMCCAHVFPNHATPLPWLLERGVRFGKGLQLVNVLRDLPKDLRQGRCYVPEQGLAGLGLKPRDLLDANCEPRFRPLYHELLTRAEEHLRAGWDYTLALPRGAIRIRLACAWPVLIGIQTIGRLRRQNVLDDNQRIKVTRADVRRIIASSVVRYPIPSAWEALFERARAL
jgi:farnesyl-diphosphate farnesyltransferase